MSCLATKLWSITLAGTLWLPIPARSGESPASIGPGRARGGDRAVEAMRREAEAAAAAHDQAFKSLAALPAPPPVAVEAAFVNRILLRRVDAGRVPGALIVVRADRPGNPDDPDQAAGAEPKFEVAEESFNLFLLGTTGDTDSIRAYFDTLLERNVEGFARQQPLTATQRKKLLLAGRGDIKRMFDRIEEARKTFLALRSDVERCGDFLMGLLPLSRELRRGPFGPGSLLEKTLRTIREQDRVSK
jgi:hypothetical protein